MALLLIILIVLLVGGAGVLVFVLKIGLFTVLLIVFAAVVAGYLAITGAR